MTIDPSAFRLDLSRASAIDALAAALRAEIPGVMTDSAYDIRSDVTLLRVRYTCPCGEISNVAMTFYEGPISVRDAIERIKELLRVHVRGEGNEPNF